MVRRAQYDIHHALQLGVVWLCLNTSCAWVEFELSPYTPRQVVAVYSEQEALTFHFWRLDKDVDLSQVTFELWRDGGYQPISLTAAPYPAEPFACGKRDLCFQYQTEGAYRAPDHAVSVRAVVSAHGPFAGAAVELDTLATTLLMEPVAVLQNRVVEPGIHEALLALGLPLRRSYDWRLTHVESSACSKRQYLPWQEVAGSLVVAYAWVEKDLCFALRPRRHDKDGIVLKQPLLPSAEAYFVEQEYRPEQVAAPTLYTLLVDLHIPDADRCQHVQQALQNGLATQLGARGNTTFLGSFAPLAPDLTPMSGCDQNSARRYPVAELVNQVVAAVTQKEPNTVRPIVVYANNIDLPLSVALADDLFAIRAGIEEHSPAYGWTIGTSSAMGGSGGEMFTGWEDVDRPAFVEALQQVAREITPFRTLLHDDQTPVEVSSSPDQAEPLAFKICRAAPTRILGAQSHSAGSLVPPTAGAAPWEPPDGGYPAFFIELGSQVLVPYNAFIQPKVVVGIEFCTRFCDHPFKAYGGSIHDNWSQPDTDFPMEVCIWG